MRSKEEAREEIESRIKNKTIRCPICDSDDISGDNTLSIQAGWEDRETGPDFTKSNILLVLVCKNCFHVINFHAGGLGLT